MHEDTLWHPRSKECDQRECRHPIGCRTECLYGREESRVKWEGEVLINSVHSFSPSNNLLIDPPVYLSIYSPNHLSVHLSFYQYFFHSIYISSPFICYLSPFFLFLSLSLSLSVYVGGVFFSVGLFICLCTPQAISDLSMSWKNRRRENPFFTLSSSKLDTWV